MTEFEIIETTNQIIEKIKKSQKISVFRPLNIFSKKIITLLITNSDFLIYFIDQLQLELDNNTPVNIIKKKLTLFKKNNISFKYRKNLLKIIKYLKYVQTLLLHKNKTMYHYYTKQLLSVAPQFIITDIHRCIYDSPAEIENYYDCLFQTNDLYFKHDNTLYSLGFIIYNIYDNTQHSIIFKLDKNRVDIYYNIDDTNSGRIVSMTDKLKNKIKNINISNESQAIILIKFVVEMFCFNVDHLMIKYPNE